MDPEAKSAVMEKTMRISLLFTYDDGCCGGAAGQEPMSMPGYRGA